MENPGYITDNETTEERPPEISIVPAVQIPPVLYSRRWIILAIFSLINMMNEVIWISLMAVSSVVREYYQISYQSVNWLAAVFSALYFTVIFVVYILNKYGLKVTIVGGALMNAISSILRLIGYKRNGFLYVLFGNIVGGIGQSFLIFIPPTLSSIWFGENERAKASSIGMAMNMFGVSVGFLMGSMFVPNSKDYLGVVQHGLFNTLLIQAIVCGVLLILSIIFIQKEPASPPSYTQAIAIQRRNTKAEIRRLSKAQDDSTENGTKTDNNPSQIQEASLPLQSTGFFKNWRTLLKNVSFHLLLQAFGIYFALFVSCNTLLNQMTVQHFPDKVKLIGIMGSTGVLFGIVSMMLAGFFLDKTHRYKLISIIIFGAASVSSLTFTLVLKYSNSFVLTFICYCVHGVCSFPYLTVGLEFVAEVMYPIKESILSFFFLFLGTAYGTVLMNILSMVTHEVGAEVAGYLIAGAYVLGCVLVSFVRGELKRYQVDQMKRKESQVAVITNENTASNVI